MARIRESTGRAAGKAPGKVWRVSAFHGRTETMRV